MQNRNYKFHYEETISVQATTEEIFAYADNHDNFSSHMNKSSWMLGGGKMYTSYADGHGQKVGSHIMMGGNAFGIRLFLDEVITVHEPPSKKEWETVGDVKLLVIGHYKLGFQMSENNSESIFRVFIDYNLPESGMSKLLGRFYAKWCVKQMTDGVSKKFDVKR